jgi:hypothetical protein
MLQEARINPGINIGVAKTIEGCCSWDMFQLIVV